MGRRSSAVSTLKTRWLFLVSLITYLLSTVWIYRLPVFGVTPRPPLIMTVLFTVLFGRKEGLLFALFSGLFADAFTGLIFGSNTLLYLGIALVISAFEDYIFKDNLLTSLVMIGLATLLFYLGSGVLFFLFGQRHLLSGLVDPLLLEALYNVLIGVVLFKWLFRYIRN